MPRPAPSLASVAADLARHLAGERPAWISAATWRRLRAAAEAVRDDAAATIARDGVVAAAEALGVHRDTLRTWRAGWLAPEAAGDHRAISAENLEVTQTVVMQRTRVWRRG